MLILGLSTVFYGCSTGSKDTSPDKDKTEGKTVDGLTALQNKNCRRALAMAFDKSFITSEILSNGSFEANFLVPREITAGREFRAKSDKGYNGYDVAKAKEYWDKAKEELGASTIQLEILTFDTEGSKKITEYLKAQYEANLDGIEITINQQPFENKLDLANKGQYQINFKGWSPDYPDPMTYLDQYVTNGPQNHMGYSNEEYDKIIQDGKSEALVKDQDKRWSELQKAEKILLDNEVALIPIYQRATAYLQQSYLKDVVEPTFGPDLLFAYADTKETDGKKIIRLRDSADIPTMDLSLATNSVSFQVIGNTMEGLYKYSMDGTVTDGLVTEVKEEGNIYTFKLRKDSKWSNGTPVTAKDFVYSIHRLGNPKTGAQYSFLLQSAGIKNATKVVSGDMDPKELGVKALDDYTLQIEVDLKVPFFKDLLAFPSFYPQNQEFVEAQGDKYGTTMDTVLYNGPFKLTKWKLGYEYELEKNPDYYDVAEVKVDAVNFRIIKDASAAVNLYNSGDIDRTSLSSELVSQYIDDPNYKTKPSLSIFFLEMNVGYSGKK